MILALVPPADLLWNPLKSLLCLCLDVSKTDEQNFKFEIWANQLSARLVTDDS